MHFPPALVSPSVEQGSHSYLIGLLWGLNATVDLKTLSTGGCTSGAYVNPSLPLVWTSRRRLSSPPGPSPIPHLEMSVNWSPTMRTSHLREQSAVPTSSYKPRRRKPFPCWVDSGETELLNTQDLWNLLLILRRFTFLLYPCTLI